MTKNQLLYQQNQETIRSNLMNEELTRQQRQETQRHNLMTERDATRNTNISARKMTETERHNLVSEFNDNLSAQGSYLRGIGSFIKSGTDVSKEIRSWMPGGSPETAIARNHNTDRF